MYPCVGQFRFAPLETHCYISCAFTYLYTDHAKYSSSMFLWGTINPLGEKTGSYKGLYLTDDDIKCAIDEESLVGLPVKIEHTGVSVGKVLSTWDNLGRLDVLLEVDEKIFEGDVVSRFVRSKVVRDLSLGYTVGLQFSEASQSFAATKKTFQEVSIVRVGARDACHIHGFSTEEPAKKRKIQTK